MFYQTIRCAVLLVASGLGAFACAVNPEFMPGDAFFHSILTKQSLSSFGDERIAIEYSYPGHTATFCGYAGFNKLAITGNTAPLADRIKQVYNALRISFPREVSIDADGEQTELNGFHLFVYPKEFEWSQSLVVGVKYNEEWKSLPDEGLDSKSREWGPPITHVGRYTSFLHAAEAVVHDWRYGPEVPGLPVTYEPGTGWGIPGPPLEAVAKIDVAKVQVLIVPENLDDVFGWMAGVTDFDSDCPSEGGYFSFYAVTTDGVTKYHSGSWGEDEGESWGLINSEPWSPEE